MKNLLILTVGICLLISVPMMADQAEDEAAIREATSLAIDTDDKQDIETHLTVYADPFVAFQSNVDRAAHAKIHTDRWAREKDFHLKLLDEIDVVFLSPDVAIHRFSQELTGRLDENGSPLPPLKNAVARVYAKKNGKWLVVANFSQPIEE